MNLENKKNNDLYVSLEQGCKNSVSNLKDLFSDTEISYNELKVNKTNKNELTTEIDKHFSTYIPLTLEVEKCSHGKVVTFIPTDTANSITAKLIGSNDPSEIKEEMKDVLAEIVNILTNPLLASLSKHSSTPLCSTVPHLSKLEEIHQIINDYDQEILTFSFQLTISDKPCDILLFFPIEVFKI